MVPNNERLQHTWLLSIYLAPSNFMRPLAKIEKSQPLVVFVSDLS